MKPFKPIARMAVVTALLFTTISTSAAAGSVTQLDDTQGHLHSTWVESALGANANTVVTISKTDDNFMQIRAFYSNSSNQFIGSDGEQSGGTIRDMDIANVNGDYVVTAVQLPDQTLKLISFAPNSGGSNNLVRIDDFDRDDLLINLASSSEIEIVQPGNDGYFVTAALVPGYVMRFDSWQLSANGVISHIDSMVGTTVIDRISMDGSTNTGSNVFATATRQDTSTVNDAMKVSIWTMTNGAFSLHTSATRGSIKSAKISLQGSTLYTLAIGQNDDAEIAYWDIDTGPWALHYRDEATLPFAIVSGAIVHTSSGVAIATQGKYHYNLTDNPLRIVWYSESAGVLTYENGVSNPNNISTPNVVQTTNNRFFLSYIIHDNPANSAVIQDLWRYIP